MPSARDADEFRAVVDPAAALALQRLLEAGRLPTDRTRPWHAVSSVLLATADGHVLLARNRYGWGTVGGHVEATDASLRAAVIREVREEVGLDVDPATLVPLSFVADAREFVPGCTHWDFCFTLTLPECVDVLPADDVAAAAWFVLDQRPPVNAHMAQHLAALDRARAG